MRSNPVLRKATLLVFLTSLAPTVLGQAVDTTGWQELKPVGEEFSILMPKDPMVESGKMPYHRMEINTRLYLSHGATMPTFAVVSLSGIKSNPAMYSDLERLNSYVDAFKKFFVPKVATKEVVARFVMTGPKLLNGHSGRQYQVTIGDRSGTAQVFATRRRFYAVVFLANKKADDVRDQFLSSFVLPEFVARPAETVANKKNEPAPEPDLAAEEKQKDKQNDKEQQEANTAASNPSQKPGETNEANPENKAETPAGGGTDPAAASGTGRKPISGGVLNNKALSLPLPNYPAEARAANAAGSVTVQVLVDEWGTVTSANVVSGHPLLRQAAVAAAMQARFSPTTLMGEPVKVTGVLVYNFTRQ